MHSKTTVKYHSIPSKTVKKTQKMKSHTLPMRVFIVQLFSVLCYILKSTIFIPNELEIPLIGIYQIKMSLHAHQQCWLNVYSSSIVKSLNLGTTQMPLNSR